MICRSNTASFSCTVADVHAGLGSAVCWVCLFTGYPLLILARESNRMPLKKRKKSEILPVTNLSDPQRGCEGKVLQVREAATL